VVPGDGRPRYEHGSQARQILNDAEDDLRDWRLPDGLLPSMDSSVDGGGTKYNAPAGSSTPAPPSGGTSGGGGGEGKQVEIAA